MLHIFLVSYKIWIDVQSVDLKKKRLKVKCISENTNSKQDILYLSNSVCLWAFGLVVWFLLWVQEVPSSILGTPLLFLCIFFSLNLGLSSVSLLNVNSEMDWQNMSTQLKSSIDSQLQKEKEKRESLKTESAKLAKIS